MDREPGSALAPAFAPEDDVRHGRAVTLVVLRGLEREPAWRAGP
jgi:hypothetical protein